MLRKLVVTAAALALLAVASPAEASPGQPTAEPAAPVQPFGEGDTPMDPSAPDETGTPSGVLADPEAPTWETDPTEQPSSADKRAAQSTSEQDTSAAPELPVVNMGAVDTAAFVEGYRGNQPKLGDDPSTKLIQRALTAKGFKVKVDGRYSRDTTKAYAKYQRSLGYKGIDANGIPGPGSLGRLGKGRFTVTNLVEIGSRHDKYRSKRVNTRTKLMLAAADSKVSWKINVTQGSYCVLEKSGCAKASAGTHDGGGSIDIKASSLSKTQRWRTVQALRSVGFAAWLRVPSQCGGCWSTHIHAVAIGDTDMWQKNGKYTNRDQVGDYYVGRNGLAKHQSDNTPKKYRVPFITWEQYSVKP